MDEIRKCGVCNKTSKETTILDAVLDKDILELCENCVRIEGAVIIPEPTKDQLTRADKPYTVYERLVRASGIDAKSSSIVKTKNTDEVTLSSLQDEWLKTKEKEKTDEKAEGNEGKIPEIQEIQKSAGKKLDIDFRSKNIKIADLHNMRERFFSNIQRIEKDKKPKNS